MGEGKTRRNWGALLLTISLLCQGATATEEGLKKSDPVLNINTCYECTHGLTEEETYHIHGCTSNLTNSCQRIQTRCMERCDNTRKAFELAIQQTFERMSYMEDLNVESVTAMDFLPFEKDFQTVKVIQSCVDQGVPVEWTVFASKIRNSPRLQEQCNVSNKNTTLTQLLVLGTWTLMGTKHGCPIQWISPVHRALFYQRCLQRFPIKAFKRKARLASRKLQNLALEQKRQLRDSAKKRIISGFAGVLFGLGIVISPLTAGGSLSILGSAMALGLGAAAEIFAPQAIKDGREELNRLMKESQQLSILLLLYTQSASRVPDFQENRRMQEISKRMINEVEERCFKMIPRTAANVANVEKLSIAWLSRIVAERARDRVDQINGTTMMNIANSQPKTNSPALAIGRRPNLLKGPFKPILKNFLKYSFKKKIGLISIGMQIGIGVYDILTGLRKLRTGLHHHIITAARRILHDTDSLIFAYSKIMGEDQLMENSAVKELYSVDLHVTNANWGLLSGSYLTLRNGAGEGCNTPQVSGWALGWTKIQELGECSYFRFKEGNLSVAINFYTPHSDIVQIDAIQASTDGNYVPTLDWKGALTAKGGRTEFVLLKKMLGLKRIKTHTSNIPFSGTDGNLMVRLRWIDGDGDEQLSKQVDLNNFGDDREFGWSDIYKGQTMARLLGDILDFYPQDTEDLGLQLQLKLDLGGSVAAAWNTDLIKLYFAADEGREIVMRCVAGERWLHADNRWKAFNCSVHQPRNPAKSLQMISAHTCDLLYSSSTSNQVKLKICKARRGFEDFENSEATNQCCSTNFFNPKASRNSWSQIDTLDNDGGEALGRCEGFELAGTAAFIAIENSYKDQGCFDEFHFFGSPGSQTEGSVLDISFANCAFPPVQFDSNLTRQVFNYEQDDWLPQEFQRSSIFCSPDTVPTTQLISIQVGICDFDYAGTSDQFQLLICSKDSHNEEYSDCCLSESSGHVARGNTLTWQPRKLGSCWKKKLKPHVSVRLVFPGSDGICIDKVTFNSKPACHTCVWADSGLVKRCASGWKSPSLAPVRCDMAEGKTIKKITVKVCENDEAPSTEKLVMVLENDNKETCWTSPLEGPGREHVKEYSTGQLGGSCSRFKVTESLRVWISTTPGEKSPDSNA